MTDGGETALRRVATLVAAGASAGEVFAAVANEVAGVLDVTSVMLARYEPDRAIRVLASVGAPVFTVGKRFPLDGPSVSAIVFDTGRPGAIDDYSALRGAIANATRDSSLRSTIGVPIVVNGHVWGVVAIATDGGGLPAGSQERLERFTELVAIAIANAESREQLERLVDEQAALRRVATHVAEGATPGELSSAVAAEVSRLLDVSSVAVVRYEPDGGSVVIASLDDPSFPVGSRWPVEGPSLNALVFATKKAGRIDHTLLAGSVARAARASGIQSGVGVPIIVDGDVWGMIAVGRRNRTDALPPDTEERLAAFTDLVATSISNADSRSRLHALVDEQAAQRRVATLVATAASPDAIIGAVVEEVGHLLALPRIELLRYESDGESATVIGAAGDHPFPVGSRWVFDGPSIMAAVRRTGRSARIDDYSSLPGTVAEVARKAGLLSAIGAPIVVDGRTWGAIIAISTSPEPIPEGAEGRLVAFTDLVATAISNLQSHDDLRMLVDEQAALRRVATLVAEGGDPQEIFEAVCVETGRLVGAGSVNLSHYTSDGDNVTMAGWSARDTHVPVGTRFPITPDTVAGEIIRTRQPARVDSWDGAESELAQLVRSRGIRSSLGAPVMVEGQLWGALVAASDREEPLPAGTEFRLARFTELIATSISNAATRADLIASRARIVTAGDEARRRIERNLHDGTQQRLIALGLDVQRVRASLPPGGDDADAALERMSLDLESVLEELRELSRGLHPPLLSRRGLRSTLRALTRSMPIPVDLDVDLPERPPELLETALYYIVSEALTNAVRHSHASAVSVTISSDHPGAPFGVGLDGRSRAVSLHATVVDDGIGGAEPAVGSGLMGLHDRVDALGGRFSLVSPPGQGTRLTVELPVSES